MTIEAFSYGVIAGWFLGISFSYMLMLLGLQRSLGLSPLETFNVVMGYPVNRGDAGDE